MKWRAGLARGAHDMCRHMPSQDASRLIFLAKKRSRGWRGPDRLIQTEIVLSAHIASLTVFREAETQHGGKGKKTPDQGSGRG